MHSRISRLLHSLFEVRAERPYPSSPRHGEFRQQLKAEGYLSQWGQDKWVFEKLFPGEVNGVFVDIGAHDGITLSNTCFLERKGWRGLAIEPNPSVFEELTRNRNCSTVQGCITPEPGKGIFRMIAGHSEMLSGLVAGYDSRHISRIDREISLYGGNYRDIEVDCYNLVELLQSRNVLQVDYLSIDVEGVEYEVLKSIDYRRVNIVVIGVENNYCDWRVPRLLNGKGYRFHSIVGDEFYVKRGPSIAQ